MRLPRLYDSPYLVRSPASGFSLEFAVQTWENTPGAYRISLRPGPSRQVDAVVYDRIIDALKAIINVQNYTCAVSQAAQTSLRSVIGQSDMDQILSERDKINARRKDVVDAPAEKNSTLAVPVATLPDGLVLQRHFVIM